MKAPKLEIWLGADGRHRLLRQVQRTLGFRSECPPRPKAACQKPQASVAGQMRIIEMSGARSARAAAGPIVPDGLATYWVRVTPSQLTTSGSQGLLPRVASLQKPSAREYCGHRLFDSRRPRRRLLGRGKVLQVTPLPPRRQCLEGALEPRVFAEPFAQFLGNREI